MHLLKEGDLQKLALNPITEVLGPACSCTNEALAYFLIVYRSDPAHLSLSLALLLLSEIHLEEQSKHSLFINKLLRPFPLINLMKLHGPMGNIRERRLSVDRTVVTCGDTPQPETIIDDVYCLLSY